MIYLPWQSTANDSGHDIGTRNPNLLDAQEVTAYLDDHDFDRRNKGDQGCFSCSLRMSILTVSETRLRSLMPMVGTPALPQIHPRTTSDARTTPHIYSHSLVQVVTCITTFYYHRHTRDDLTLVHRTSQDTTAVWRRCHTPRARHNSSGYPVLPEPGSSSVTRQTFVGRQHSQNRSQQVA